MKMRADVGIDEYDEFILLNCLFACKLTCVERRFFILMLRHVCCAVLSVVYIACWSLLAAIFTLGVVGSGSANASSSSSGRVGVEFCLRVSCSETMTAAGKGLERARRWGWMSRS